MDKLYYDCPLQAAYMSKEFGVLLLVEESYSNDSWLEDATPESLMKHIHLYGEENTKIFKAMINQAIKEIGDTQ